MSLIQLLKFKTWEKRGFSKCLVWKCLVSKRGIELQLLLSFVFFHFLLISFTLIAIIYSSKPLTSFVRQLEPIHTQKE